MPVQHVVIAGASLAGLRTAQALRAASFTGTVTMFGEEPDFPYDRPPLSKQYLSGAWPEERLALARGDALRDLEIDLRLGARGTGLDLASRTVQLDDGASVRYDALVIATGARSRTLPGLADLQGIHVLRTLQDAIGLRAELGGAPRRLVVVGAGFIGSEVAATAHGLGHDVTVLEALPVPMSRALGPVLGPAVARLHLRNGVQVRVNSAVTAFEGTGKVERVRLADGSALDADLVLVGIGVVPNTEWLEGSGLELRDGVVCTASCSAAGTDSVWAAGDVARWYHPRLHRTLRVEHWTNAAEQGLTVARNILGRNEIYAPVPYVWSDQYGSKIQILGQPGESDETELAAGSLEDPRFVALTHHAGTVTSAVGIDSPRVMARLRSLLASGPALSDAVALAQAAAPKPVKGRPMS
jgi:3-phenylpropionate/trans-cinnamate dioxygenase ferredoxin reductase component